jgi:hypothetical protein
LLKVALNTIKNPTNINLKITEKTLLQILWYFKVKSFVRSTSTQGLPVYY